MALDLLDGSSVLPDFAIGTGVGANAGSSVTNTTWSPSSVVFRHSSLLSNFTISDVLGAGDGDLLSDFASQAEVFDFVRYIRLLAAGDDRMALDLLLRLPPADSL